MQKILRTLIIIAMLITGYLLVLAWQKDYNNVNHEVSNTAFSSVPQHSHDVPMSNNQRVVSDVPIANSSQENKPLSSPTSQLIRVVTDKYELQINPIGGDVVYAALKDQAQSLKSNQPFVLLENHNRVYIAQSGLIGKDGIDKETGRAVFSSPQTEYVMQENDKTLSVPLTFQQNGVTITKQYTFERGAYPIQVSYNINNLSEHPWQGQMYAQLKRDNSKDPGLADKGMMGLATYLGGAWGTPESPYNKLKFGKFNDGELNIQSQDGWVAIIQHYFVSAWTPSNFTANFYSKTIGQEHIIGFTSKPVDVNANQQVTFSATLYAGPKIQSNLQSVAVGLDKTVDYGVVWPIAAFLFWVLEQVHKILGNWGWSIIVLTLLVKMALFGIANKSYYSMAKMRMVAPRLQQLKDEFGDDRMRMSQEMMKLYKEENVNPMAGCLPILLQMPIFFALYWVLVESVELRHAPWIFWIHDLSAMDPWFVLPIIMGATMYFQQMLNPQPQDPMQANVMRILPIIFAVFMLFFPAGLVLYWTVNNLFAMVQQYMVNQKVEKEYQAKENAKHVL